MKARYLMLFLVFLISCSTQSEVESEVNKYVERNFHDPESYELIELKLLDTITMKEAVKYLQDERSYKIESINLYIKERKKELGSHAMSMLMSGDFFSGANDFKEGESEIEKYTDSISIYTKENEKLEKFSDRNDIIYFKYQHNYRAKNNMGALVKCIDTLRINPNNDIVDDYEQYLLKILK